MSIDLGSSETPRGRGVAAPGPRRPCDWRYPSASAGWARQADTVNGVPTVSGYDWRTPSANADQATQSRQTKSNSRNDAETSSPA